MKAGELGSNYFARTLIIANKMRIHRDYMKDVVIIKKILRSMTQKYDYVICSIRSRKGVDKGRDPNQRS